MLHSVRALAPAADALVVVAPAMHVPVFTALLDGVDDRGGRAAVVVGGGETRAASVAAGLRALPDDVDVVAVHDAARPLVTVDLLRRCVAALDTADAVAPAVPVTDTVKRVGPDEVVEHTVDRAPLRAVQTPQVFHVSQLRALHAAADPGVTDDLQLVEAADGVVRLVPGDPRNLKVTFPHDLAVAEALLADTSFQENRGIPRESWNEPRGRPV